MKKLRPVVSALLVTLLTTALVWAASPFVPVPLEITVDSAAPRELTADPASISLDGLRPGDQASWDISVTNVGTDLCADILVTARPPDRYVEILGFPPTIKPLMATQDATVRILVTLAADAPDGTTRSVGLGLVCVR